MTLTYHLSLWRITHSTFLYMSTISGVWIMEYDGKSLRKVARLMKTATLQGLFCFRDCGWQGRYFWVDTISNLGAEIRSPL